MLCLVRDLVKLTILVSLIILHTIIHVGILLNLTILISQQIKSSVNFLSLFLLCFWLMDSSPHTACDWLEFPVGLHGKTLVNYITYHCVLLVTSYRLQVEQLHHHF